MFHKIYIYFFLLRDLTDVDNQIWINILLGQLVYFFQVLPVLLSIELLTCPDLCYTSIPLFFNFLKKTVELRNEVHPWLPLSPEIFQFTPHLSMMMMMVMKPSILSTQMSFNRRGHIVNETENRSGRYWRGFLGKLL